jgi:quinolinate synthase
MPQQVPLHEKYLEMSPAELQDRIARRKEELGSDLCILGHHYQSDEIVELADFVGDSLKLSQQAASRKDAKYIVFCGVHFMAESAAVLSTDDQAVCLPHLFAGCNMADMADATDVQAAMEELEARCGGPIVPVTYVNSTAAVKAVTARAGGACCTSSNARNVFEWALRARSQGGGAGKKVLAIPDQHLGRNTAVAMGYSTEDCAVYDPHLLSGGLADDDLARATFVLWKGHCYVHQVFKPDHVRKVRAKHPDIFVIVHPECPYEVVGLSDASGSTEQIIRAVTAGSPGSKWAVGTESNLVNRLARRHGDRFVRILSEVPSFCAMMARIDLPHLLWVLDNLAEGKTVNRITVASDVAADARVALERMIAIKPLAEATPTRPAEAH